MDQQTSVIAPEGSESHAITAYRAQKVSGGTDSGSKAEKSASREESRGESEAESQDTAGSQNQDSDEVSEGSQAGKVPDYEERMKRDRPGRRAFKTQRIADLSKEKGILQSERDQARQELQSLRDEVTKLRSGSPQPTQETAKPQADDDPRPDAGDVAKYGGDNGFDKYIEDLTGWQIRQREKEATKKQQEKEQTEFKAKVSQAQLQVLGLGRKQYSDFDQVVLRGDLPITDAMTRTLDYTAMLGEKDATQVAGILYHLGKNPDVAKAIAGMPPEMQYYAMGQLATELRLGNRTPISGNTTTMKPVRPPMVLTGGGGAAGASEDLLPIQRYRADKARGR